MTALYTITECLKVCQEAFPTKKERHSLTYNKETEKIELSIYAYEKWWSFVPGDKDLENIHAGIKYMKEYIEEQYTSPENKGKK